MYTLESLKKENPSLAYRINQEDVDDVNTIVCAIEELREDDLPHEMDNVIIIDDGKVWRNNYSLVYKAGQWYAAAVYANASLYKGQILYSKGGGSYVKIDRRKMHISKYKPKILKSDFWCWKGGHGDAYNGLKFTALVNNWVLKL